MTAGTNDHCKPETFEAFFGGTLPEPAIARMTAHLSVCPDCLLRAKSIGDAWISNETWMIETRQKAEQFEWIENGLAREEARETNIRETSLLRSWRHRVLSGEFTASSKPRRIRYALVGARRGMVIRTRGTARKDENAVDPAVVGWMVGGSPCRIVVPKAQPVWIGLDEEPPGSHIALVPESAGKETLFAEIAQAPGGDPAWIARFEIVPPGVYDLIFEDRPS